MAAGELCVGATIPLPSPDLVELAAAVGFDFVTIDVEHEAIDDADVAHMIRAAEAYDVTPIVRTARDADRILRYLNGGAQGIHVPRCNSAADAREIVEACRFHPAGKRTFWALGRAANWAMIPSDEAWSREANHELLVVAMVEEVEGLCNLEAILAEPGLDAIHIGPKDLWQSMGMPAQAAVDEAVAEITTRASAAGKVVSLQFRIAPTCPTASGRTSAAARGWSPSRRSTSSATPRRSSWIGFELGAAGPAPETQAPGLPVRDGCIVI